MNEAILLRFLAAVVMVSSSSIAADHYVRRGGTCTSSCDSWTNAADQITTALATAARGDTIWIADGTYNAITLNRPASGTTSITLKKATIASHGTDLGWVDSYGDGQADIGGTVNIRTSFWLIDGQVRNDKNWKETSSYGIRVRSVRTSTAEGTVGHNITLKYIDIGGPDSDSYSSGIPGEGIYIGGFSETITNWTIQRCRIHNVHIPFQFGGIDTGVVEYNWIGPNWGKEAIRGQIVTRNMTIRHNFFGNACIGNPDGDGTCTGQIAFFGGTADAFDHARIYGNVFHHWSPTTHTDGCIVLGSTSHLPPAKYARVYNNTIVGVQKGTCILRFNGGTNNEAVNNIWSDVSATVGCNANVCESNSVVGDSSLFVNASSGDFRLTAAFGGRTLTAPYDQDQDGRRRAADGVWDRGAYEFSSGTEATLPLPPSSLKALVE